MRIFSNTTEFEITEPTVVAIGKFDGDHIGHRAIIEKMRSVKKECGYKTVIFSFYTPPADVVLRDGKRHLQVNTSEERRRRMSYEGIDYLIEYPFNTEVASTEGWDFVEQILIAKLNMHAIVGGEDMAFGHNKSGNAELLKEMSRTHSFEVYILEKIKENTGREISTTLVKELLSEGEVEKVRELLGVPYAIEGIVEKGNHIGGSKLGYPTANIYPDPKKFIPKVGVYATRLFSEDRIAHPAMTNVGTNPTIEDDGMDHMIRIETNVLDYEGDLYGKRVLIQFIKRIRDEQKFDSIEQLSEQLKKDEIIVRSIF